MITELDLKKIKPKLLDGTFSPLHIQNGVPIPKPTRVKFFSPEEWEVLMCAEKTGGFNLVN